MEKITFIETELKKFNITDAAIMELQHNYGQLTIDGLEDVKGYHAVRAARLEVKGYRVEVEKKRKELGSDALKFQRAINEEAKRISAMLESLEECLFNQESFIDNEKEKIKQAAIEARELKMQQRRDKLTSLGFVSDGVNYTATFINDIKQIYPIIVLKTDSDEQFDSNILAIEPLYKEEQERLKIERDKQEAERIAKEAEMKAAQEALDAQRKEQEAERLRLAEIDRQQKEQQAIIQAEKDNAERQRWLETESKRLKKEAEETLKFKMAQEAKLQEEKRIASEKREAAKLARLPDKQKLKQYFIMMDAIPYPVVSSREASIVLLEFTNALESILQDLKLSIENL